MTPRCPYCGKPVQTAASFCIHCGEPTDEDSLHELSSSRGETSRASLPYSPDNKAESRSFSWSELFTPGRKLEFVFGFALLLAVLGLGVYSAVQSNAVGSHYRKGIEALGARDYDTARDELIASDGYQDAAKRLKDITGAIEQRDQLYSVATKASAQGKWWTAGKYLKMVEGIEPNYKDVPRLLEKARGINGIVIYRLDRQVDGEGSIYISEADGTDTRPIPNTDYDSSIHAVSTDGRWVIYSTYRLHVRTLLLYDVAARTSRRIVLPMQNIPTVITARFTSDNTQMWIVVDEHNFVVDVPAQYSDSPLVPNLADDVAADQVHAPQVIVEQDKVQHTTTLSVADYTGENKHLLTTEKGTIDGAMFSNDRHFLLYRTCVDTSVPAAGASAMKCTLNLLNLQSPFPKPAALADITLTPAEQNDTWGLSGEFTRDGDHLNIIWRKGPVGTMSVYRLDAESNGTAPRKLQVWSEKDQSWALTQAPFIWAATSGLQFWKGPNSQASTTQTIILPEGTVPWAARAFVKSHWLSVAPGDQYALFIVGKDRIASAGDYWLCVAPLNAATGTPDAAKSTALLYTIRKPSQWLPSTYILPDGQTLLSTVPPSADAAPGLYSYDLQTGSSSNDIPNVTDIWFPGYSSLLPNIPVFTWHNE